MAVAVACCPHPEARTQARALEALSSGVDGFLKREPMDFTVGGIVSLIDSAAAMSAVKSGLARRDTDNMEIIFIKPRLRDRKELFDFLPNVAFFFCQNWVSILI